MGVGSAGRSTKSYHEAYCETSHDFMSSCPRGCEIELTETSAGKIQHVLDGRSTFPTIRSYDEGIKVGCTFLTTSALERLYKWHTKFLSEGRVKTHQ